MNTFKLPNVLKVNNTCWAPVWKESKVRGHHQQVEEVKLLLRWEII